MSPVITTDHLALYAQDSRSYSGFELSAAPPLPGGNWGRETPSQGLKAKTKLSAARFAVQGEAAMAGGSLVKAFCEEATCSVCLEYFTDPVTTDCGHNFCRACLTQCWGEPGKNASCPQCREPVQQRNLRPNRQLANIAEIAKKSRLRETKQKEGTGGVCERHQEPLKLFCRDDEAPICMVCDRSKEHREHRVIPTDEAVEEYKEKIQAQFPSLEEERERLVELKVAEEQRNRECLKQLEEQKLKITSVIKEMHKFLEEKEHIWLRELADLEKEIKERQEENMTRLSEEISHFSDLIKDVEEKCQQPASEFLQDIRHTWGRCQEGQVRQRLELSPGLEWRLRSCCPNGAVLEKAMKELAGSLKQALGKVSVTLDPETANPHLVLSEDLKSVRSGTTMCRNNPERFTYELCVLGCERFTSGRHCWEVEVQKLEEGGRWAVGVARVSLRRKKIFMFSPSGRIWAVGNNPFTSQPLSALTFPKWTPLTLSHEPRKIRVFLDYEEGCVEFFDADTDNLIFSFPPASFSREGIRPFFWVEGGVCLKC